MMIHQLTNQILQDEIKVTEAIDQVAEGWKLNQMAQKMAGKQGISLDRAKRMLMGRMGGANDKPTQ